MSPATDNPTTAHLAWNFNTRFWRFVWKEFRMLRGLWLAVAMIGLVIQLAERVLMLPSLPGTPDPDLAWMLFATGLSAAVLYAVGAAATTFSVEHEEDTYDLLARLPTTWQPVFAGKLLVTIISAVLLALLLSGTGWLVRGSRPMSEQQLSTAVGMMGVAIFEAVAWGMLFSLIIKRPLLAAIITLVVGTAMVNVAVSFTSKYATASLTPAAYVQALPLRLAIVAAVFACSVVAARGWLTASARPALSTRLRNNDRLLRFFVGVFAQPREAHDDAKSASRRRMLTRLLWQTWRESWKLLLAPLAVGVLLLAGVGAAMGLSNPNGEVASFAMSATLLFAPALYGAMAFYADQRRSNYRFLAEHAARPRYAWLARHIVWLGALVAVWFLMIVGLATLVGTNMKFNSRQSFEYYLNWGMYANAPEMMYELAHGTEIAARVLIAASFGALVAYGVGQLFSMTVRSEILAAFLALLLTLVISAWIFAICLWQLSATLFMLPIFAGLMLATWLRAPDWIAGRNSLRAWLKPALAIIAPLLLIAAILPAVRLAQLQSKQPTERDRKYIQAIATLSEQDFAEQLAAFRAGDTNAAAQTADMYAGAATKLTAGSGQDLLERWRKPEYLDTSLDIPGSVEIDVAKIPRDQTEEFENAQKQQLDLIKQSIANAVNEAIETSNRPTCRFRFDASSIAPTPPIHISPNSKRGQPFGLAYNNTYQNMNQLIGVVAGEPMTEPDQPARRFLAALKMEKHLRSGQPTVVVLDQLKSEQEILQRIGQWSLESIRTKDELRDVLDKLTVEFLSPESPMDALLADHLLILSVIEGKETPYIVSTTPIAPHAYLAYLANQLWWERERAQQALDRITRRNIYDFNQLTNYLNNTTPREIGVSWLRRWLRPDYGGLPEAWEIQEPAALTSYLVSLEYKARVPISALNRAYCDNVTWRRATLLQVALALYRLDHKKYPTQLAELVPDYFKQLPLDPYSRQAFQYLPSGLELPLKFWTVDGYNLKTDPHSPLFWSVGVGNVRLKEVERAETDEPLPAGEELPPEKSVPQYEFVNEEQMRWNSHPLVFPLSK